MFPRGFFWGAATAAYQIEGSPDADGKGESIWDRFAHAPGTIRNGDTGDVACDSYRRWRDDIALLAELGLNSYRFSIAWTRVQPDGHGAANRRGIDHYRRFCEALVSAGIRPLVTLYHWDLPQALEDAGGWPARDTAYRFAEYCALVSGTLGDVVNDWATFNEPHIFTRHGYLLGNHAPGRSDPDAYLRATHTVNLAHGLGVRAIRADAPSARVGCVYSVSPVRAAANGPAHHAAVRRADAHLNRWFLDPPMRGTYPRAVVGKIPLERIGYRSGDEAIMRAPLDWIGLNYYFHQTVRDAPTPATEPLALQYTVEEETRFPRTDWGWPVNADGLREIVVQMARRYPGVPLEVTENGCSYRDAPGGDGIIRDERRIAYLHSHLRAVSDAIADGADVRGYHHWSLLDNFEWAEGYAQRFGLTYVDARTGQRTVKESGRWYARVARANHLPD